MELKALKNAPIIDLAPALNDFADTAATVSELDLIIMTDSAVAHLAGALGKPVWVLLNYAPYWMWGTKFKRSLWYESLKADAHGAWGDWRGVFDFFGNQLLQKALRNKVGGNNA